MSNADAVGRRQLMGASAAAALAVWAGGCGPLRQAPAGQISQRKARISTTNHTTNPDQDQLKARAIQRFRERYPSIEVEEITAPGPQINEKVLTLLAAGTPPDVLHVSYGGAGGIADLGGARGAPQAGRPYQAGQGVQVGRLLARRAPGRPVRGGAGGAA